MKEENLSVAGALIRAATVDDAAEIANVHLNSWREAYRGLLPQDYLDPEGNDFSCKFVSDRERTFLIRFALGDLSRPTSCCRWSADPFWAPRRDVLRRFMPQKRTRKTAWWIYDVPLPGPFGFGTDVNTGVPRTFWFPVLGGAWA